MSIPSGKRRLAMATVLAAGLGLAHSADFDDRLLGDWGGLRTSLAAHGLDLEVSYTGEFAANVSGGTGREQAYADQIYLGGSLDLQRLTGVPAPKIVFSFTDRNGESLSTKAQLNTLLEVQEIFGEGDFARLNQLYLDQWLFGNTVELKFGRLTGTFDFMPFSCYFQNITFCATLPSHNVIANWVAFPGSTWAGIARVQFKHDWYAQAGVYEVNPAFQQSKYRFAFGIPFGGQGKRTVVEVGWLPKSAGPDGGYSVGAWYDDVGGNDLYLNTAGQPLATAGGTPLPRDHQSGFYAMAQQRIWAKGGSDTPGLSVFANFVQGDRRITKIEQIAEIGVFWTGVTSWRPQDDLGAAIGRVHVNSLVAQGEALYNSQVAQGDVLYNSEVALSAGLPSQPQQRNEYPMEIHYSVNVTPAIVVRPNIQFIHAPGGVTERADVLVFGVHLGIQF
jgi:porin